MPNGIAKFLKHIRTLGQRRGRKTSRLRPARATGRAMALTGRGTQPSRPGFFIPVTPRASKARKAKRS